MSGKKGRSCIKSGCEYVRNVGVGSVQTEHSHEGKNT